MSDPTALLGRADNDSPGYFWPKLLTWRGEGTNRFNWKVLSTITLLTELSYFFYYTFMVLKNYYLVVMGALTLIKFLIEIWGQETPTWICPGGPVVFFMIFVLIIPGFVYTDSLCTKNPDITFPYHDFVGFVMFLFGSFYSLSYEVSRFEWKKQPENKGRLHTIGLAKSCIHPNYFGDLFTYGCYGVAAGTTCALSIPLWMVVSFVFIVNPNSDAYLAKRYSHDGWKEYSEKTATFVPGIIGKWPNIALGIIRGVMACFASASCAIQCE